MWQQVTKVERGQYFADGAPPQSPYGETTVENLVEMVRRLPPNASAVKAVAYGLRFIDSGALAALLKELNKSGHGRRAQEIFDGLRALDAGHELKGLCNTMTFTTMISQCGTQQALRRALELVGEMRSTGIPCNVHTYSALMNVCIKGNELDLALDVYRQMLNEGITPNLVTYNTLIDVYGKTGSWQEAVGVLDALTAQGVAPEIRTYNTAIIACNMSGQAGQALQIYERMLRAGAQPTATTYTALISAYGKSGQLDKALGIFQDMIRRGCERNVITYSSLISACEKVGRWELALNLFHEMHAEGCRPNVVTFNSLIAACAQGAQWEKAQELFNAMPRKGCRPDAVTYGSLITAYDRAGQWQRALTAYESMKAVNCRPDSVVYNTVIGSLWQTGLLWAQAKAMFIFHCACKAGHFRLTVHTHAITNNKDNTSDALSSPMNTSSSSPNAPRSTDGNDSFGYYCGSGSGSGSGSETVRTMTPTNTPRGSLDGNNSDASAIAVLAGMHPSSSTATTPTPNSSRRNSGDGGASSLLSFKDGSGGSGGGGGREELQFMLQNTPAIGMNATSPGVVRTPNAADRIGAMTPNSHGSPFPLSPMSMLSSVSTCSPTTAQTLELSNSSCATITRKGGGTMIEFGMHAFTVGSGVLSVLRWICELRERLPCIDADEDDARDGNGNGRMMNNQNHTVALLLNKGKSGRDQAYPAMKAAISALLTSLRAPLAITDVSQGARLEGAALDVARWLRCPEAKRALTHYLSASPDNTNSNASGGGAVDNNNNACSNNSNNVKVHLMIGREVFFQQDSSVEACCSEAFAAVRRFEDSYIRKSSSASTKTTSNNIYNNIGGGSGGNFSTSSLPESYASQRSDWFSTATAISNALGLKEEVPHDCLLLIDRAMGSEGPSGPLLTSCSAAAVITACLSMAASQAGVSNADNLPHEEITGVTASEVTSARCAVYAALGGDTSAISTLRVLKLYLERLGADLTQPDGVYSAAGDALLSCSASVTNLALADVQPSLAAAAVLMKSRKSAGLSPFWPRSLVQLTALDDTEGDELMNTVAMLQ